MGVRREGHLPGCADRVRVPAHAIYCLVSERQVVAKGMKSCRVCLAEDNLQVVCNSTGGAG